MKKVSVIMLLVIGLMLVATAVFANEAAAAPDAGKFGFFGTVRAQDPVNRSAPEGSTITLTVV